MVADRYVWNAQRNKLSVNDFSFSTSHIPTFSLPKLQNHFRTYFKRNPLMQIVLYAFAQVLRYPSRKGLLLLRCNGREGKKKNICGTERITFTTFKAFPRFSVPSSNQKDLGQIWTVFLICVWSFSKIIHRKMYLYLYLNLWHPSCFE